MTTLLQVEAIPPLPTDMIKPGDLVIPKSPGLQHGKIGRVIDTEGGWMIVRFERERGESPLTLPYKAEELDVRQFATPKPDKRDETIKELRLVIETLQRDLKKANDLHGIAEANLNHALVINPSLLPKPGQSIEFDWHVIQMRSNAVSNHSSLGEDGAGSKLIASKITQGWQVAQVNQTTVAGGKNQPDDHYLHVVMWKTKNSFEFPKYDVSHLPIPSQYAGQVSVPASAPRASQALRDFIAGKHNDTAKIAQEMDDTLIEIMTEGMKPL